MGDRGPAPMPTPIRKMRGNPGKRPLPEREPEPAESDGNYPSWLPDGRPRTLWSQLFPMLQDMRVMSVADESALALLCTELAEYIWATNRIRRYGRVYELQTKSGGVTIMQRPEVGMKNAAWANSVKLLDRFGMTPSGRTKVQKIAEEEQDEFGEMFG